MTLYPANPVFDAAGHAKPFNALEHAAFQALLATYGEPGDVAVKEAVWRAVRAGKPPGSIAALSTRHGRIAARVALRQLLHSDGGSPALLDWHRTLERGIHTRSLAQASSVADAGHAAAH